MTGDQIVRLRPAPGLSVDALLATSIGLDVWERGTDHVLAAATEAQLSELERRGLAIVERLGTREQYESRMRGLPGER